MVSDYLMKHQMDDSKCILTTTFVSLVNLKFDGNNVEHMVR